MSEKKGSEQKKDGRIELDRRGYKPITAPVKPVPPQGGSGTATPPKSEKK